MKFIRFLLNVLKIVVWIAFTGLVALLYAAFYSGFFQAIEANDPLNIYLMSPFIGLYALVHYLVLLLINRLFYHDEFFGFKLFPALKTIGGWKGVVIAIVALALGIVSAVAVAALHIYVTLLVFRIIRPKSEFTYTPSSYTSSYTSGYTPSSYYDNSYTSSSSSSTSSSSSYTPSTNYEPDYDYEAYKRYIMNNLSASDIYVNAGYSKFVKSAKVTSLSFSFSKGSTPSVKATATVTVYINSYAVRQYIGVDSHHNSTYANSNVVDSEISSAMSDAKDSARSEIESKIRSLTRSFASQYGGPSSVNESAYVSARKVQ